MSKKNKKKNINNTNNSNKSNQVKEQINNIIEKTDSDIKQESQDNNPIETTQDNTNQDSNNNIDETPDTNKEHNTDEIYNTETLEKDIKADISKTISPEENDNLNITTSNQTPTADTTNKSTNSKLEHQTKEEKNKTNSNKNKKIVAICATTALVSSLTSIAIIKSTQKNNTPKSEDVFIEEIESKISAEDIGKKLEAKKLIDSNTMFTIDYTFDSRFDLFKDNILDIYTKVSNSDENFEEVFIIKNNNTARVEECLNVYKANLINRYNTDKEFKDTLDIVENTIIKSEKGITYFIASNKKEDVEKMILNEINI